MLALLVAMVSVNTHRPLDFSAFPSVLLIATVLRLALNVASTRVVLAEGHNGPDAAGHVIEAFGEFVIGGNYTIGILVFIILVVINLSVITKGAGRVSEVTARFTLDAMPGKQMAIDADLNAGLLTNEEAKTRRADVAREADFYGAMDGASKFVKGDAIAGIIILLINIFGGLLIGVVSHGLTLSAAAETYIKLTIGDGLVAQIPSLLLSIATAIIITRTSERQELGSQIAGQMALPHAWGPASAIMGLIGLMPGMPGWLFLPAAAMGGYAAHRMLRRIANAETTAAAPVVELLPRDNSNIEVGDISDSSRVKLEVGYSLASLADQGEDSPLVARINGIRKQLSRELGIVVPVVRITDNLSLEPHAYRILLGGMIVGEDRVEPDRLLAINAGQAAFDLPGPKVVDPCFGLEAIWVDHLDRERARAAGYTIVDASTVIATHLQSLLQRHAAELLDQDDVQSLLDNLGRSSPNLVANVVPKIVPVHTLTTVLRHLLGERVPIVDLRRVLDAIAATPVKGKEPRDLAESIRPALGTILIQRISAVRDPLRVVTIDSDLEQLLHQSLKQAGGDPLGIEPGLIRKLGEILATESDKAAGSDRPLVLVTTPALRYALSLIFRGHVTDLTVLAYNEIPSSKTVDVVTVLGK
jgi:flagellar biosynthesis protein FlhA